MRNKIDEKSAAQGYAESRLPQFTEEEEAMVLGSSDFLGLNIYTSFLVYPEQVTRLQTIHRFQPGDSTPCRAT